MIRCDSWSSDFALYLEEDYWCMNFIWTLYFVISQCDATFDLKNPVILPYILSSIWRMNVILLDNESVWCDLWPQNTFVTVTYISWSSDLLYFMKTIGWLNIMFWDRKSVWPDFWPQHICRSQWSIFHSSVILSYILKTNWWKNIILWDTESVRPNFDLIINVGQFVLYFMVQWFCPISWRLFDGWTSSFWIISQCDSKIDLILNGGHNDLYFTFQEFCLFIEVKWFCFYFLFSKTV